MSGRNWVMMLAVLALNWGGFVGALVYGLLTIRKGPLDYRAAVFGRAGDLCVKAGETDRALTYYGKAIDGYLAYLRQVFGLEAETRPAEKI